MPTLRAVRRAAKNLTITLLLLSTILISISANTTRALQPNPTATVTVSPGKWDLSLGNDTSLVKLSYPNSTILANSVGDLLFTVSLEVSATSFFPPAPGRSSQGCMSVLALFFGDCQFTVNIYIPPDFTFENFLFVFAFSIAVSIIAGAYPAWRASRLDPVVALRKE